MARQDQALILKNQEASMRNLERQMGQMAKQITEISEKRANALPGTTENNPKDIGKGIKWEECKAITLRSGKKVEKEAITQEKHNKEGSKEEVKEQELPTQNDNSTKKKVVEAYQPMLPYPQRECSAIIQRELPRKRKDPGSFHIPCTIGNMIIERAFCDHGASINLLPLSLMKKLQIHELKSTQIALQMAEKSIKQALGLVENVLVKVGKFFLLVDFVILDIEEDHNTPVILGRPLLSTGRALIDVEKGELMLRVYEEHIVFHVFKSLQDPNQEEECKKIDLRDPNLEEAPD
ncbi:uncharacterized protein LOC107646950 [Arachis ipaensis]|uniref:uncharacterized protein LOC107646950 n=1 Tax=Arachis ipaensis TaxID=130454 RepID=UPI0007AFA421|nr:uncharacterized protein LOC107646950 [Arachis ipaensis]XP_025661610.1 uncharacterized protein LOC112757217 [Arachis hypogaea]